MFVSVCSDVKLSYLLPVIFSAMCARACVCKVTCWAPTDGKEQSTKCLTLQCSMKEYMGNIL